MARDGALSSFRDAILAGKTTLPPPERPDEFLRKLMPLCRSALITRVGDLTGLDRIGLPVVQAVRPGALSEVTSLGRGLSMAEAAIGAIMESLERFYAESVASDRVFLATADDFNIPRGLFDNLLQPNWRGNWRGIAIPWIIGIDVATGFAQPVPLELVHTQYTEPPPRGDGLFVRTTTGLACHASCYGAFLHGVFECIERDAIARAFATHGFFDRMRMATSGLGEGVDRLLSCAGESDISVAFWHVPSPTKVPVVWCQTIETSPGEPILALPTEGHSAGPSIDIAASDALLEALVTRAGAISGTRDDMTRKHYRRSTEAVVERARQLILEGTPTMPGTTIEPVDISDVSFLVHRIASAGLGPVLAVSVGSDSEAGVECVRTILSGARPFSIVR
jgi:ribosomal protein S12 methylthiotransferase accessory factor